MATENQENSYNPKEIKSRAVKGVLSFTVRAGLLQLIALIASLFLSAYLTPSDFGIYYIVTSIISLLTFLSDIGLAATLVQKKENPTLEELRTTFTIQQILAIGIFLASVLLTPLWRRITPITLDGLGLLYALSFSFILASFKTIPSILLERKLHFDKLIIPQIVENLVFYILVVYYASHGFGLKSYTIAVLARSIIGVVVMYIIQQWPIGLAFTKKTFLSLIKFGTKFQLNDLLARIKDDLFVLVMAWFIPSYQLGLISWAKKWSSYPSQLSVNSVVSITFPTFSRLQHDTKRLSLAIEKSIYFITLFIFPMLAGMVGLSHPLTVIIPSYAKWQPALFSLALFCINIGFSSFSTPLTNTLNAIGKVNITLKLMLMLTALTWTLTPICVYFFGFNGVAIASALISLTSFITVYLVRREVNFNLGDQVWRQLTSSLVMLIFLFATSEIWQRSIWFFIVGIVSGGLVYIGTLAITGFSKLKYEIMSLRQS